jgi:hypothetical protein
MSEKLSSDVWYELISGFKLIVLEKINSLTFNDYILFLSIVYAIVCFFCGASYLKMEYNFLKKKKD